MTMQNNYGAWLDSEKPSPGVISANKVNSCFWDDEGICLDCEDAFNEIEEIQNCPNGCDSLSLQDGICLECGWEKQDLYDSVECFDHTMLFGDWKKDEASGKYIPDESGEFAAVYTQGSFHDITVVWSKFTTRGTPCSPCAPKCVSIPDDGKTGEFLCYTLPKYLLEEEE